MSERAPVVREPDGWVLRTRFPDGETTDDWFIAGGRTTEADLQGIAEGRRDFFGKDRKCHAEVLPVYIGSPEPSREAVDGMRERDEFAGRALAALIAAGGQVGDEARGCPATAAAWAYEYADAMLKERQS